MGTRSLQGGASMLRSADRLTQTKHSYAQTRGRNLTYYWGAHHRKRMTLRVRLVSPDLNNESRTRLPGVLPPTPNSLWWLNGLAMKMFRTRGLSMSIQAAEK